MRDITARMYQVTRLDEAHVNVLHDFEISVGYPSTPWMIKKKFRLNDIGDVPEEFHTKQESQIIAIYEKTRAEYKTSHAGCCFKDAEGFHVRSDTECQQNADIIVLHQADWNVRDDRHLNLNTPMGGGKAKQKIQDGVFGKQGFRE